MIPNVPPGSTSPVGGESSENQMPSPQDLRVTEIGEKALSPSVGIGEGSQSPVASLKKPVLFSDALAELDYVYHKGLVDENALELEDWMNRFGDKFGPEIFDRMSPQQKYDLAALVYALQATSTKIIHYRWMDNIQRELVEIGVIFSIDDLQQVTERIQQSSKSHEEKQTLLASYISYHEIPASEALSVISREEFSLLMPYLRFLDLRKLISPIFGENLVSAGKKLNVLYVDDAEALKSKTAFNCRLFSCSGCTDLKSLPKLPHCHWLDSSGCPLEEIQVTSSCTVLNCSNSPQLKRISGATGCVDLLMDHCPSLESVTGLDQCQSVTCVGCKKLKSLSLSQEHCKAVNCTDCAALETITGNEGCESFECTGCVQLRHVPPMPNLKFLRNINCPAKITLPDSSQGMVLD